MKLGQCSIAGELYKEESQSTIIHVSNKINN